MSTSIPADKPADPYREKNLDTESSVEDKVLGLLKFTQECKFGLMTTRDKSTGMLVSRCMAVAAHEQDVDLIFHTNKETGKAEEIIGDPHVNIGFLNNSGDWASMSGVATIESDSEVIKKYYTSQLKAWLGDLGDKVHDGSQNDPRLGIIRVKTLTATYAVSQATAVGRGVEVAKGIVTGNAAKVNKLRELSEAEIERYRTSKDMVQKS